MRAIFITGLIGVLFCGMAPGMAGDTPLAIFARVGINPIAPTDAPFDELPLMGGGVRLGITPHLAVEAGIAASGWSDYLGMYGGRYDFKLIRLGGGIQYALWTWKPRLWNLRAGVSLVNHFFRVSNALQNPYPGDLQSHLAVVPALAADLCPFHREDGFLGRLIVTGTLEYPVNGGFSDLTGLLGVGFWMH